MDKKIIALDLDGTLLNKAGYLTDYTLSVIERVRQAGHTVLIATGRPYRMTKAIYDQLKLDTPMVNFNGSLVHIPGQVWAGERSQLIDKRYLLEFLANKEAFQADFIASEYKDNFYITPDYESFLPQGLLGTENIQAHNLLAAEKVVADPYSILLQTQATDKYALGAEMRSYFNNELEINTWGGPLNILETCAKGVTKGSALAYLLETCNWDPARLVVFGDEHNDIQMFELAGTSYAMKNASELLLPYATHQTQYSNDEDGVAKQLEELFL